MAEASAQPTTCFSEDLSNELKALRSIFTAEGEISVDDLGPGGDYCFVVQLKPRDIDVGLQFLIPGKFVFFLTEWVVENIRGINVIECIE